MARDTLAAGAGAACRAFMALAAGTEAPGPAAARWYAISGFWR